uniref:Reverse transcriptase domain-containing protein n=1 Tax=Salarias fasciatus TaxID=181472 RepID=A0A672IAL3_SALFA
MAQYSSLFICEFSELLTIIHSKYSRILITGDFNLHLDDNSDSMSREFLNLLNCLDFKQHVAQPTHNRGHTLDLVITHGLSISVSSVFDLAVSDHYCVFFNITSFNQQEAPVRTVRRRYLTSEVAADFIEILQSTPAVILPASCDFIVDDFNSKLKSSLDSVAPLLTKTIKGHSKPPWRRNDIVIKLKRNCRSAERRWRKSKLTVHHQILRQQLKIYNNAVKQARTSHFSQLISDNKDNPRFLFSTFNILTGTNFNKAFKEPTDALCEDFADHFRTKIMDIRSSLLPQQVLSVNTAEPLSMPEETLDSFDLVDARTLGRVFSQVKSTTCLLDPIPTPLFKSLYGFLEEQILNIMNSSLQTGVFPTAFKTAVVKPLLKKSNLDPDVFNNYRPVSNLPFLSKVLERLVFNQVNDFLMINNILERHQSGFRVNHSTETALLKILNDIRWNLDNKKLTVMVLLDLSAAFDTVDHHILINRLSHLVGLSGTVLNWFSSFLTDRCFYVSLDTCSSGTHEIRCGVPQGSILGPILFNLYMLPLGDVIRRHGISFHSYADDTQLYIAVSPDDSGPIETLFNCISDIKSWMAVNFLQLNQDKTEVLVIGPEGQREKILPKLRDFKPAQLVKNLGVIFDSELSFIPHIKNITKIGFYHLKNIARVRPFLSQASTEVLMHAFISCRLDYCNALLSGLPKKNISNLQLLQNAAARVLTRTRGRAHITPVLQSLHWLPVRFRIDFKVLLLVFKCLNGLAPSYLADLFLPYRPSRALRSSGSALLCVPKARTKTHGEAAFSHYGPRLWNSLPENLRTAETVDIFKGRLKTHLFNQAFN